MVKLRGMLAAALSLVLCATTLIAHAADEVAPPAPSATPAPEGAAPAPDGTVPEPEQPSATPAPEGVAPAPDGTVPEPEQPSATPAPELQLMLTPTDSGMEARIAMLEAEIAALKSMSMAPPEAVVACAAEPEPELCPDCGCELACDAEDAVAPAVAWYGDIYLQWRNSQTDLAAGGTTEFGDIDLYWGEIGLDASLDDWHGHFSLLLNDEDESIDLHEAYARWQRADDPWFFQVGRTVMPWGNNAYYFPTYPAVNDLGYSTLKSIGGGYDSESTSFSAYAYNSPVDIAGEDDTLGDFAVAWSLTQQEPDACQDGWQLTVGYNSNLGAHDLDLAGVPTLTERVPAVNAFARYDFHSGNGMWHFLADYTYAMEEYALADLDADADGVGDKPSALNTELVYEIDEDLWGVNYQLTDEMADYAETRWGVLYGHRFSPMTMFKLEYTHGEYGDFATAGQTADDTLVGEINLAF